MAPPGPIIRAGRYLALGFNFSGTIAGGAIAGWLIDRWLGTAPWATVILTLLGVVGAFVWLIAVVRRFEGDDR